MFYTLFIFGQDTPCTTLHIFTWNFRFKHILYFYLHITVFSHKLSFILLITVLLFQLHRISAKCHSTICLLCSHIYTRITKALHAFQWPWVPILITLVTACSILIHLSQPAYISKAASDCVFYLSILPVPHLNLPISSYTLQLPKNEVIL